MKKVLLVVALLAVACIVNAQVKTDFQSRNQISVKGKFAKNFRAKTPFRIPGKNIQQLLQSEAAQGRSGPGKPFYFAEPHKVAIDVVREASWVEEGDYAFGKFTVNASGAKSIGANFDQFYLPEGSEMYVYNKNGEMVTGPITEEVNNPGRIWKTWFYKGDLMTIEVKTTIASKAQLQLHMSNVAYGYKDVYVADFGASAGCNINVICAQGAGWETERNSVALILNSAGSALCSGALINTTCNDHNYFLTANHCFNDDPNETSWSFTFLAFSSACAPSINNVGATYMGSTLRARNAASDFCLLELSQTPAPVLGITASGWSRAGTAPASGVSITHPRGDVMKIATYTTAATAAVFLGSTDWDVTWAGGTVEPGSSGGPLFNNNHQIVGQVHGGNVADICTANDHAFFGRFDQSWTGGGTSTTRLSDWLDPTGSGAMEMTSRMHITGPPMVCTTAGYSINNPVGTTVSWTSSAPTILSINSSTGVATKVANGTVTITATVTGTCTSTVTTSVVVGAPTITGPTRTGPCGDQIYSYTASSIPGATYTWSITNPNLSLSYAGNSAEVSGGLYGGNGFSITVNVTLGSCTISFTKATQSLIRKTPEQCQGGGGGGQLLVTTYPNPASSVMNAEIIDDETIDPVSDKLDQSFELTITDKLGRRVFTGNYENRKITIPLDGLRPDIYYLAVHYKETVLRKQIVVQRHE